MKSFGNVVGRESGSGGSMASMPHPKTKRIGRRRGHGIETVTARETEVNCPADFVGPARHPK